MLKRTFVKFLGISLVLTNVLLAGCKEQEAQAVTTQSTAASAFVEGKRVVVGIDGNSMPMAFWDHKGNAIGYDVELAREVFKRAKMVPEFRAIQWSKKEANLLEEKTIDVIWSSLTITDDRKKIFSFSTPYIKNSKAILVRADSSIQTQDDLGGTVVAVQEASNSAELVKRLSGKAAPAKVEELMYRPDIFSAVLNGKADAAVTDSVSISYYVAHSPDKFRMLTDRLQEEEFGVAVRPADKELLAAINKALAEMQADGTSQAIYKRWFEKSP